MKLIVFSTLVLFYTTVFANVNGTHLQNFNPTTNGLDFITVQSSKTLPPAHFNLGVSFNYATNSLPFFKAPGVVSNQKFEEPNDKLLSSDLNIGFGVMDNWEFGLSLPMVLSQDINNSAQLGSYDDTGLTEFRINSKYRAYSQDNLGVAVVGSVNFDRVKNSPFAGADPGPTWNLEAVVDYQIDPQLLWAFNIGYRFFDNGSEIIDTDVKPLGDQMIFSTAVAYNHIDWDTSFVFELFGSDFLDSKSLPTDRKLHNLEAIVAAKKSFFHNVSTYAGLGTELYHGFASPDLRIFLGMNWLIGPVSQYQPAPPPMVIQPVVETTFEEVPSETIILSFINFDTEKARMTPESRRSMDEPLAQLRKNSDTIRLIIVEGHADNTGTNAFNQTLSEKRAKSVREVLLSELGLANNQVQARGFGETRPVTTNDTLDGRTRNRRVELKIYRNK
jgi:outer membrane protein OmpA-like peptidoglycan-associated protein